MVDSEVTCGAGNRLAQPGFYAPQRRNGRISRASLLNGGFRLDVPVRVEGLPLEERCTQASGNGHILENASLDPESDDFLPHPLAIWPSELNHSSNRQAVWKRALVRWHARAEP